MVGKIQHAWSELMKLPEAEQEVAADAILDYASGGRGVSLSDEQVAEVERRLAEPTPKELDELTVVAIFHGAQDR